jgi:sulfur-oxidizing protein SoxY
LAKTGTVTVVANVDGKLVSASKLVKVTIGGCGG